MNGRNCLVALCMVGLVLIGLAPQVLAQAAPQAVSSDTPPDSPDWGISAPIAYVVPGWTFNPLGDALVALNNGYIYKDGGNATTFCQTIHLPSGAAIDGVTTFFYDADPSADAFLAFDKYTGTSGSGFTTTLLTNEFSSGSGGYQGGYHALLVPETVRNVDPGTGAVSMYLLQISLSPSGPASYLRFGGVTVWYRLQISPAPATATFSDVPTGYWAFRHIEALAASGITAGCGGGNYCPENTVTRAEMAVFLAKALGLHWPDGTPE